MENKFFRRQRQAQGFAGVQPHDRGPGFHHPLNQGYPADIGLEV